MNCDKLWSFPGEMILEILARLPVKSLLRGKAVCKLWHKLVSDEYLVHLYGKVALKDSVVLVEVLDSTNSSLTCVDSVLGASELSLCFLEEIVKVWASCNGLAVLLRRLGPRRILCLQTDDPRLQAAPDERGRVVPTRQSVADRMVELALL